VRGSACLLWVTCCAELVQLRRKGFVLGLPPMRMPSTRSLVTYDLTGCAPTPCSPQARWLCWGCCCTSPSQRRATEWWWFRSPPPHWTWCRWVAGPIALWRSCVLFRSAPLLPCLLPGWASGQPGHPAYRPPKLCPVPTPQPKQKLCDARGWSTARIDGGTDVSKRQDVVNAFNSYGVGQARRLCVAALFSWALRVCIACLLGCTASVQVFPPYRSSACILVPTHPAGVPAVHDSRRSGAQPGGGQPPGAAGQPLEPGNGSAGAQNACCCCCRRRRHRCRGCCCFRCCKVLLTCWHRQPGRNAAGQCHSLPTQLSFLPRLPAHPGHGARVARRPEEGVCGLSPPDHRWVICCCRSGTRACTAARERAMLAACVVCAQSFELSFSKTWPRYASPPGILPLIAPSILLSFFPRHAG